jgi:cell division protein FtsW (lipid II flippase)
MKWYEYLKSTKQQTSGEDFADSIALIVLCGLVFVTLFLKWAQHDLGKHILCIFIFLGYDEMVRAWFIHILSKRSSQRI